MLSPHQAVPWLHPQNRTFSDNCLRITDLSDALLAVLAALGSVRCGGHHAVQGASMWFGKRCGVRAVSPSTSRSGAARLLHSVRTLPRSLLPSRSPPGMWVTHGGEAVALLCESGLLP